jgi:ATP-dependent exoDNAse (exonuclease V) beta subunit
VAIDNANLRNAIKLLAVHKSKCLEAKTVFVLNVIGGKFGFPSAVKDPSILVVSRGDNEIETK